MIQSLLTKEPVLFRAPQHMFVYGTLKKGFFNHYILSDISKAFYCGEFLTKTAQYVMYDYGAFPIVSKVEIKGNILKGELYIVTPDIIRRMDKLEGHPWWYKRSRIILEDGTWAFTYLQPPEMTSDLPEVPITYTREEGDYQEWFKSNSYKVKEKT